MIYTLTMNPCLDRYLLVDQLHPDDTNRVKRVLEYPAGKGIDVSRVIREMEGDSVAITLLGGTTGNRIRKMLDSEMVLHADIFLENETRTNTIIQHPQTQYRFSVKGSRISPRQAKHAMEYLDKLVRPDDIVVISGSVPPGTPREFYYQAISLLSQRKSRVFFDSDAKNLSQGLRGTPFGIKPNVYEFERLTGEPLDLSDRKSLLEKGQQVLAEYELGYLLLSLGEKGAFAFSREQVLFCQSIPVEVKSAVGAGDSFLAGFVLEYAKGSDFCRCFRTAMACGNASVMTPGTELCRKEDVLSLQEKLRVEEVQLP
ncbi:MAG TPA: 1-phosphofructokinase family hexose kinase [Thermotogota bacterium]|nr:1-phosphofructokinase family hexose kinase [Thermotogota bacterium]HRW92476.1 1-phosphofructokinase family hexose kinase [Thermotogota bacterium]